MNPLAVLHSNETEPKYPHLAYFSFLNRLRLYLYENLGDGCMTLFSVGDDHI